MGIDPGLGLDEGRPQGYLSDDCVRASLSVRLGDDPRRSEGRLQLSHGRLNRWCEYAHELSTHGVASKLRSSRRFTQSS